MKKPHTQQAFFCILIPLLQLVAFAVFGFLATITEFPTNRNGIYVVFSGISIILLFLFPLVQLVCGIKSVAHQVHALRNQESKAINYVMMAVSILYFVSAVWLSYLLWVGIMSV